MSVLVTPAGHLDNLKAARTLRFMFSSHSTAGVPTTLAGTPAISVYVDASDTQVTTGVTLTADADSTTGLNRVLIDLSDAFYAAGSDFHVVITTGTVSAQSVVGTVVATFSIENRTVAGQAGALTGNLSVAGTTTLTGAVTATNASNDIRGVTTTALLKKNTAFPGYCFAMRKTNGAVGDALTVTARRSIDGAAFATCTNTLTIAEVSDGTYSIDLSAADLNGNNIMLVFTAPGARQLEEKVITHP